MSTITQRQYSADESLLLSQLHDRFGIDPNRVLFFKPGEPWLPSEELIAIARQADVFQSIHESFDQDIPSLSQVAHTAMVTDKMGRTFSRSGVATIGEMIEGKEVDAHDLAASRALRNAMGAAGFNPFRVGAAITLDLSLKHDEEAQQRNKDLRRIHALAVEKRYIKPVPGSPSDTTEYRNMLREKYGVISAAGFDATQRLSLINHLEQVEPLAVEQDIEQLV
ncbi:MAG: hypothetical protein AUG51_16945 [Acidobacteria bacterium 13_1_20CM_3_53_8]|nr:MAG: hypothetical protein AUG51_16945 [Acidobacteria bacterium 13_1_20CM_3_53_8]